MLQILRAISALPPQLFAAFNDALNQTFKSSLTYNASNPNNFTSAALCLGDGALI